MSTATVPRGQAAAEPQPDQAEALAPARHRGPSPRTVLAITSLGAAVAVVDATIVNIAFPNIAQSFHGPSISSLSWVLTAYNIVFASFLVPSSLALVLHARLGPSLGGLLVTGALLFAVASAVLGVAIVIAIIGTSWPLRVASAFDDAWTLGAACLFAAGLACLLVGRLETDKAPALGAAARAPTSCPVRMRCRACAGARWLLLVPALALWSAPVAGATAPYAAKRSPLLTPWTGTVSTVAPLPEYPRPQLERSDWLNLNGRWQYEAARAGQAPPFGRALAQTILVPFGVQSPLSGIERGDTAGWYRRTFRLPAGWAGRRVLLNFGAVSWSARVYVNGRLAGTHRGDYDGFSLDITPLLHRGANELLVGYVNPIGGAGEPVGKQVPGAPYAFYHSASSGIWQTVWLEPVAAAHVTHLELRPDLARERLIVAAAATAPATARVVAEAFDRGRLIATASGRPGAPFALAIRRPRLWSPADPFLYALRIQVVDGGRVQDSVRSYFGMRSISLGRVGGAVRILLNGRFVFQSGALDQGYWPDGLYTAPADAALRFDLEAAKELGYDMLRMHVKVEADRWYYWADKLGILVWQDMPNMPITDLRAPGAASKAEFRRELSAIVVQRDAHPSIVAWVPFNEGWGQFDLAGVTRQIKQLDPTRLVDTQSGSANCCDAIESAVSNIRDSHLYFGPYAVAADRRASVIGEYGGVLPWAPAADRWPGTPTSIGSQAASWPLAGIVAELRAQYAELALEMRVRGLSASVFTELGAYEQELGIVSYDRRVFTLAPALLRGLNGSLIAASQTRVGLTAPVAAVPPGTTGLWHFDEGQGTSAADASGGGHPLTLEGGGGWVNGVHGSALSVAGAGQQAVSAGPLIDTRGSFTVAAWMRAASPGQSGSAVSEQGATGSSFSLGVDSAGPGIGQRFGSVASGIPPLATRTWWTFVVPAAGGCPAASCGVHASMHYDDGRTSPIPGTWHYVTGVYDAAGATTSVYVDGVPEDVEHVFGLPPASGPLTVGAGVLDYTPTDAFVGSIDELRTYARALTPTEVWQLYRAAVAGR